MDLLLYYQVPVSKLVTVVVITTVTMVVSVVGIVVLVKLYGSRLRALEAEKKLAQLEAAEKTRQRIAEDLHSSIGQSMAAAKALTGDLLLQVIEKYPEYADALRSLHYQLGDGLNDLRQLSQAIHGERLLEAGILYAIKTDIGLARRLNGCVVKTVLPEEELPIPHEAKVALYRMFQNALANVYRHAQANRIEIALTMAASGIILIVADNGVGFDTNRKQHHPGLGLDSIRQHAAQWGGHATIASVVGRGTTVTIQLPNTIADE